ncbi:MAG: hypothetical protein AB1726_09455 [Planctomycetota bacterium]
MNGLAAHVLFFLALSLPIVVLGAFYSHPEDGPALRSVPKRYTVFVLSCALVALLMLALEALFASA